MKKWFDGFLESFDSGVYHAQYGWIKPWQYKNLMKTAEINNWNMISQKQLDVFLRNMKIKQSTWEEFGKYENDSKIVNISISTHTGFTTITISNK